MKKEIRKSNAAAGVKKKATPKDHYASLSKRLVDNHFHIEYFEPPLEMEREHWHNHIEFNYFHCGGMAYLFNGKRCEIPENKMVFFWGGIPHRTLNNKKSPSGETARLFNVYVPLENFLLWEISREMQSLLYGGKILALEAPPDFIGSLVEVWRGDAKNRNEKAMESICFEIRALLSRYPFKPLDFEGNSGGRAEKSEKAERPPRRKGISRQKQMMLVKIMDFIMHRMQEPIHYRQIAHALGYHENYVQRVFRELVGVSIHRFLNSVRLKYVGFLLRETDKGITEIAFETGFGSVSQFYKAFGQFFGESPKSYRLSTRHSAIADRPRIRE